VIQARAEEYHSVAAQKKSVAALAAFGASVPGPPPPIPPPPPLQPQKAQNTSQLKPAGISRSSLDATGEQSADLCTLVSQVTLVCLV
jgi:hypothetical protein